MENISNEDTSQKKPEQTKQKRIVNDNYIVKKRIASRPKGGDNVIFVTRKTNFKAQLDKCCELLTKGENEIIIHGLGSAIQRCCNLALQVEKNFAGTCELEVNTGTVCLVDDLEPLTDDLDYGSQVRNNSAVHIKVSRTAMLGANQ
ncbi:ribonuclease P protein subunit p20 [Leptidea sinapis]|uniref:ribonuclease P protein subunit p20 n=1 Tax=Leptidea sinapis TaxID=189913 RepID=UPI002135858A|nr:ribonuclease P protein subunit p20 [Leptidea sinapis]